MVRPLIKGITLRVILKILFGEAPASTIAQLYDLLDNFFEVLDSPLSGLAMLFPALRLDLGEWSPWGKFIHAKQQIHQVIDHEIQRRRQLGMQ